MRQRLWHRTVAAAAAVILGAALTIAPASPALASTSGYEWMYTGPSPARGYVEWNLSNSRYNNVQVFQTGALAWNHCLTTWFDWNMNSVWPITEHFDARAIKNCQAGSGTVSMTNYDIPAGAGWWYVGQQKLAFCYGQNQTVDGCVNGPQASQPLGSVDPWFDTYNTSTRWYARWSSGSTSYFDGGDPRRHDA